ncbi:hypothetical protein [Mucilaginibacter glaciei]|uniref:DUF3828 domain-containing protein n=1 Tax=Mucilaginibacter glaciei TaxID=2772109 RepID=A0A926NU54_9SPHI|nr:hypothetical protein [Mucilaginibacter glaciei]MBD1394050.1 hypothetical protein [Mucilaginibacter glaciei]
MSKYNLVIIILAFLHSVSYGSVLKNEKSFEHSRKLPSIVIKPNPPERPAATCIKFLRWYVSENAWLEKNHFFKMGLPGDTTTPYVVNYENLKLYKIKLKRNGRVSDKLLDNIQMRYDSAANYLKVNPQIDGPVFGFDTDPLIQLQEEDMLTNYIKKIRVGSVRKEYGNCYVRITVSKDLSYIFVLSKYKNVWLIDSISPRFEHPFKAKLQN